MPIISKTGRKSVQVRVLYTAIFGILIVGAFTMIYPFVLMLVGSTSSNADRALLKPYPEFWFNDTVLYRKFVESKYNEDLRMIESCWGRSTTNYTGMEKPDTEDAVLLDAFLQWRDESPWWLLGHCGGTGQEMQFPQNTRRFRTYLVERFDDDLDAMRTALGVRVLSWSEVYPPFQTQRQYTENAVGFAAAFKEFAETRPVDERIILNPDGDFVRSYLVSRYGEDIERYNTAHGTAYPSYADVFLAANPPANTLERADWSDYVRNQAVLTILNIAPEGEAHFRAFLRDRYHGFIDEMNHALGTRYTDFDAPAFHQRVPKEKADLAEWLAFVSSEEACPTDLLSVVGPRQSFEAYLQDHTDLTAAAPVRLPIREADWVDTQNSSRALRWEFTTRAYRHVTEYLLRHGKGFRNTAIYCLLAVLTALTVNPLAAYGLSRYRPPQTYLVLLVCMAVMAFPAEITMIPAFLLMKRFPLWPLLVSMLVFVGLAWAFDKAKLALPEWLRYGVALLVGFAVGFGLLPAINEDFAHLSLLNTFWALVLPGAANGFAIFLLKGFFDSLPQELYEAAEIDGASEWTQFWTISMNLSKPILAVIALNAFVAAYTAFMMALIIIPDPDMWTLMVWIFQLQSRAHQSVVYASLVMVAIPTFVVFLLCQNVIIRGIVVPTEK